MKKKLSTALTVVLFSLCLAACTKNIDNASQFEKLGITTVDAVTDGNLYEGKSELFTNTGDTLEVIGYKYTFSAFYTFATLEDIEAGFSTYLDTLRGAGYSDVATNFTNESYVALENDSNKITVSYDNAVYNWEGAEGLYILSVTVNYN